MWRGKRSSQANRGSYLEDALWQTNQKYKAAGLGMVEQYTPNIKPRRTEFGEVVGVKYERRDNGVPDFIGALVSTGPIAFDAKETSKGDRFPLDKIEPEQVEWLANATAQNWLTFTIHYFAESDKAYLLPFEEILLPVYRLWQKVGGRQAPASISGEIFRTKAIPIRPGRAVALDYKEAADVYDRYQKSQEQRGF